MHTADSLLKTYIPLVYPSIHPYTPKFVLYSYNCVYSAPIFGCCSFSTSSTLSHTNVQRKAAEVLFSTIHFWIEHFYGNISKSFQRWL